MTHNCRKLEKYLFRGRTGCIFDPWIGGPGDSSYPEGSEYVWQSGVGGQKCLVTGGFCQNLISPFPIAGDWLKVAQTHMLQLSQDMDASLWYSSRPTTVSELPLVSSLQAVPMNALAVGEETVEYRMETHHEVPDSYSGFRSLTQNTE